MRRSAALSLLLLPLLSLPALAPRVSAADPPPGEVFSESIDVDVVSVDVFVTDRSGKPVRDLGRDDFELRVDGRPVAITNFSGSGAAPAAAAAGGAAAPSPAAPPAGGSVPAGGPRNGERPLTLALFLDDSNLSVNGRNPALQRLESFFRGLGRRDRVMIARYDGGNVELSLPPAGDPEAVVAELRRAMGRNSHGTVHSNDWAKALQDYYDALERHSPPEVDEALVRLRMLSLRREGESHHMLVTLASFVDALAGMPGRKAVLYLSGTVNVASGDSAIRELAERANAAGVTLYGLGAQDDYASILIGTTSLSDVVIPAWLVADLNADWFSRQLQEIVGPTGGFAAVDPSRPTLVLDRIRADFSSYYSLGFSPAAPHDGRRHALAVRVKGRRGLDVRFPAGFTARTREELLAGRTRAALFGAGERPENPLGLRLAVERDELAQAGSRKVSLLVAFPLGRLALRPGRGGEEGKAVLFVAARDSAGRSLPMRRIELPVRVPEEKLAAARGGDAAYRLDLDLPLGAATLAAGLRDEVGGGESLVVARYTAGALAAAHAATRPPAPVPPRS